MFHFERLSQRRMLLVRSHSLLATCAICRKGSTTERRGARARLSACDTEGNTRCLRNWTKKHRTTACLADNLSKEGPNCKQRNKMEGHGQLRLPHKKQRLLHTCRMRSIQTKQHNAAVDSGLFSERCSVWVRIKLVSPSQTRCKLNCSGLLSSPLHGLHVVRMQPGVFWACFGIQSESSIAHAQQQGGRFQDHHSGSMIAEGTALAGRPLAEK